MKSTIGKYSIYYLFGIGACFALVLTGFIWANVYTPQSFINEIKDSKNHYVQKKKYNDVSLMLRYQPSAFLACKEVKDAQNSTRMDYNERLKEYSSTSNYILRIEALGASSLLKQLISNSTEYQDLVTYLSFEIKKDLEIIIDNVSYPCSFVHFERNFDMAPVAQIHIGFNLTDEMQGSMKGAEEWSVKYDASRFNLGPLYFNYEKKNLIEHPIIII